MKIYLFATLLLAAATPATAQDNMSVVAPSVDAKSRVLPARTMLVVTPVNEITSKKAVEGTMYDFLTVSDITENGVVVVPRGTPVKGEMTWKTGRAVGGKSGKFEIEFRTVALNGHDYELTGKHRQEGRGNTTGALLGSIWISGKSAVMTPGQMVNVFTAEPINY